jgi:NhaP-type Na+/H+ or K+/H+ antiporter
MTFTLWFLVIGALLIVLALSGSVLKRLPLSTAMLYLAVGIAIGPAGLELVEATPLARSALLERLAEIVVIISLFSAGLKLRTPFSDDRWRTPVRLAFASMTLTVGLIALIGWQLLGLHPGAAVLLGAVLAPTDPVLAADVQVEGATDRDRLRFGLTGEAGLNDGIAFPFVMLGLGLLGLHEIGANGWRWLVVDVAWAITAGLAVGALCGSLTGRLIIYLRERHREAVGLDDFLALGLISLSYGVALLIHSYGFLAVFAAGLALRRMERQSSPDSEPPAEVTGIGLGADQVPAAATSPETAPAYMANAVLGFSEQFERIGIVAVVVLIGAMLSWELIPSTALWFVPLLFLVVRPLAVAIGLLGERTAPVRLALMSWFGIRGVGSIYYLMFAVERGLPTDTAEVLTGLALTVMASSIVLHGITVNPLMRLYSRTGHCSFPPRHERRGAGGTAA